MTTSPAVAYACRGNCSYLLNVEHSYWTRSSSSRHTDLVPVLRNIRHLATPQNPQNSGLWGNLNFRLLRDSFPYQLARGIPLKECVPYPRQSKVITPPHHLCQTILSLQISLNAWLSHSLLHCKGQNITQPPRRVQAVVAQQHPVELYRQTHRVTLYPAPHLALAALPLLSAVLKTCLPPFLIQKPAWSLQIHCQCQLQKRIRDRGNGNCNGMRCLRVDN